MSATKCLPPSLPDYRAFTRVALSCRTLTQFFPTFTSQGHSTPLSRTFYTLNGRRCMIYALLIEDYRLKQTLPFAPQIGSICTGANTATGMTQKAEAIRRRASRRLSLCWWRLNRPGVSGIGLVCSHPTHA